MNQELLSEIESKVREKYNEAFVKSIGNEAVPYLSSTVVIPEGVTSISDYAFYTCEFLTSVVIPTSVTSIGRHAFQGCTSLSSLVFKDTSTWYRTDNLYNWTNTTGGTKTTVTSAYTAATYFTSSYTNYYWYKL